MTTFKEGQRVKLVGGTAAEADHPDEPGVVLIPSDYNGDVHVRFPDPTGIGIYRPEELEVVME